MKGEGFNILGLAGESSEIFGFPEEPRRRQSVSVAAYRKRGKQGAVLADIFLHQLLERIGWALRSRWVELAAAFFASINGGAAKANALLCERTNVDLIGYTGKLCALHLAPSS